MGLRGQRRLTAKQEPRFASAAVQTYGTQLGVAILSFINVLVVARSLGPTGRGEVAFLTTIAVLSSNLAMFGIQEANANFAGAEPELRPRLATNSILFSFLFGFGCLGVIVVLLGFFPVIGGGASVSLRWLALLSIPPLVLQTYLSMLIQADYGFGITNLAWILSPVFSVAVNGSIALLHQLNVTVAFGSWVVGQVLATILLAWYVEMRLAGFGRPDRQLALRSLRFGYKWHLGRMMMFGNFRIDQWFVGAISGARELGLYSIAVTWSEVLFYLPTALVMVQRPYLVRASRTSAGRHAVSIFRAATLLTIPLAGLLVLFAPQLCVVFFGEEFHGSIVQLRVLALGAFGIVALKQLSNALTAQRRPSLATVAAGLTFVATIALDASLIPLAGGLGASLASTISYTLGGIAVAAIFARVFEVSASDLIPRPGDIPALVRGIRSSMVSLRRTRAPIPAEPVREP